MTIVHGVLSSLERLNGRLMATSRRTNRGVNRTLNDAERTVRRTVSTVRGWLELPVQGAVGRIDARAAQADRAMARLVAKIPHPLDRFR